MCRRFQERNRLYVGSRSNTYYWLDPRKRVAGVILTQILPFADDKAVALYGAFERGIYGVFKTA